MGRGHILAIALLAGGLVVGCDALFDTPEKATREGMEALFSGDIDKFKDRLCTTSKEKLPRDIEQIKVLKDLQAMVKVDLSGVNFEATVNGDTATVKASGKMKIELSLFGQTQSREQSLDGSAPIHLVREGGTWKICDKRF